jgi:hypothetical protein
VKVHNLTDVSTPTLTHLGLINVPIKVGDAIVKPGESTELRVLPASASRFLRVEALSTGANPPKKYLEAKEKLKPKEAPAPEEPPEFLIAPAPPEAMVVEDKVSVSDAAAVADTDPPADPAPRSHRRYRSEG